MFAAESLELDFAHDFFCNKLTRLTKPANLAGREASKAPAASGNGLKNQRNTAVAVNDPPYGDFTALVEADLTEQGPSNSVLISIVGATINDNIQLYRTGTGYFSLVVNNSGNLFQAVGMLDPKARRTRAAVSCSGDTVRACFDGGDILTVEGIRPPGLLRFWFGRFSLGLGQAFGSDIRATTIRDRASTDTALQMMTQAEVDIPPGTVAGDDGQAIISHNQDPDAHDLAQAKLLAAFNAAALGLTLAAADTFSGVNGVITTSEVGGLTYAGLNDDNNNRAVRTNGVAGGNLKAGIVTTTSADGQVQANLVPNADQAGLIFRWVDGFNFFLVGRGINGVLFLNKFKAGVSTSLQPAMFVPFEAGEVVKARYFGARIWVTRTGADGVETIMFDAVDGDFKTSKRHGFRTLGTGTADNLRVYSREPL